MIDLNELRCLNHINLNRSLLSVGTLGSGNHFIEIDKDDEGNMYLVVHSGSRHLGVEVAGYYQKLAYKHLTEKKETLIKKGKDELLKKHKGKDVPKAIETTKKQQDIPRELAYVEGQDFEDYIHDMRIVQKYVELNRKATIDEIAIKMNFSIKIPLQQFTIT